MTEVASAANANAAGVGGKLGPPNAIGSAGEVSPGPAASVSAASVSPTANSFSHSTQAASGRDLSKQQSAVAAKAATTSSATAHILTLGQLDVDRRLDFVTTNRVVAVLEKAVERLQLLSLLDVAATTEEDLKPEDDDDDEKGATGKGKSAAGGGGGEGDAMSKTQRILARFAVDVKSSSTAAAAQQNNAIIQEALAANAATSRPAATFASLEGGEGASKSANGSTAYSLSKTRRTAAQVTAVLAEASQESRRGRPTVAEMLAEQQRLEVRYGELLRAAQHLNHQQRQQAKVEYQSQCNTGGEGKGGGPATSAAAAAADRALHPYFTHICDAERAAIQRELKAVSQRLRDHNKHLCTQLKDAPNDGDNWRKIANGRQELMALLKQTIEELTAGYAESRRGNYQAANVPDNNLRNASVVGLKRMDSKTSLFLSGEGSRRSSQLDANDSAQQSAVPSVKRFGGTAQMRQVARPTVNHPRIPLSSSYAQFARRILQEDAAQRWADGLVRKERELNQNVKQLQSDLLQERNKKEKEMAERNQRIHALRIQLRELKRGLKQRSDEAKERAEAAGEGLQRKAHEEECELDDLCTSLQRQLTVEQRTHELFARHLRERTAAMDALAVDWQRKNPTEIKKTELKKMDAEQTRQQCSERLDVCEKELEKQETLKEERDKEDADATAAAQATESQRQAVYEAASKLQSAVRAMLTREAIGKLKKKNSKKKRASSPSGGKK